ncbi:MAG: DMT family transporter [Lentihominibacter sp.]|nr:DMT family transporter [Lentihominibacter sp.]
MKKAYIFVLITALLFGSMEVSCKIGGGNLDSMQLTLIRFVIGGIVLLPFAVAEIKKNKIKIGGKDLAELVLTGTLGIPISMVLFQMGVEITNASTASVLFCVNPVFTMVFAHFILGEKMNSRKILIMALAVIGIVFMFRPWDIQGGNSVKGMVLMMVAAFFFSMYTVSGKAVIKRIGLFAQASFSFFIGSAELLIIMLIMGRPVLHGVFESVPIILYTGLVVTGLGYFCYFKAIQLADATTGSYAFFLKPAIAPVFAVLILGENILWNTFAGIACVLGASLLNIVNNRIEAKAIDEIKPADN